MAQYLQYAVDVRQLPPAIARENMIVKQQKQLNDSVNWCAYRDETVAETVAERMRTAARHTRLYSTRVDKVVNITA